MASQCFFCRHLIHICEVVEGFQRGNDESKQPVINFRSSIDHEDYDYESMEGEADAAAQNKQETHEENKT